MKNLLQHPLSSAFPGMSYADHEILTLDIKEHGLRDPVTLFDGQVLDGWHRLQSCLSLGIEPTTVVFEGDPVAFVFSRNLHRRHLTGSQRAAAVVACHEWHPPVKPKVDTVSTLKTNAEMAKEAEVSTKTIQRAKIAHEAGLGEKVRDGELTVQEAVEQVRPPLVKPVEVAPEFVSVPLGEYEGMKAALATYQSEARALEAVLDADDKLAAAVHEIKSLQVLIAGLKSRVDGLMVEKNEVVAKVRTLTKQLAKSERKG
jgi:hypothetical protein